MFTFVVMVGETNSSKRQTERREKKRKLTFDTTNGK